MLKGVNIKRSITTIIIVFAFFFVAVLLIFGCSDADSKALPPIEVYAVNTVAEYDGHTHSITLNGVLDGDTVMYSFRRDGGWSEAPPECILPGDYLIYYKITRQGYAEHIAYAKLTITRAVLSGISADNVTVVYDGKPHTVEVLGTEAGDSVVYSADGTEFLKSVSFTAVGEYQIFYRVARAYGDYNGSCVLSILPDLGGTYLNTEYGAIEVALPSAFVNNTEYTISYSADGSGKIGDKPFLAENGVITYDGHDYALVAPDRFVYAIAVSADGTQKTLYASAPVDAPIDIVFGADGALIFIDGISKAKIEGVNYLENSSMPIEFLYTEHAATVEVTSGSGVTAVALEFSHRPEFAVDNTYTYAVYNGEPHGFDIKYDGDVLYATPDGYTELPPTFTAAGSYAVDVVCFSDGFLPCVARAELDIVPSVDGVYYNDTAVICISGACSACTVNGNAASLCYVRGWTIDGRKINIADGALELDGEAYSEKGDGRLLLIDCAGETRVSKIDTVTKVTVQITVESGAAQVTVECDGVTVVRTSVEANGVSLAVNGNTVSQPAEGESCKIEFGVSELNALPYAVIEIY